MKKRTKWKWIASISGGDNPPTIASPSPGTVPGEPEIHERINQTMTAREIIQLNDITGQHPDRDDALIARHQLDADTTRFYAATIAGATERLDIIETPDRYAIAHGGEYDWAERSAFADLDDATDAYLNDSDRYEAAN